MKEDEIPPPRTLAEELRTTYGVHGVLVEMARHGQIIELRCEMPGCYCSKGRSHFVKKPTLPRLGAIAGPLPGLKTHGGQLVPITSDSRMCSASDETTAGV